MKVYHGSTETVKLPLVGIGRKFLDFGCGFYVTDIKEQAVSWATRPLNAGKPHILNIYDFNNDNMNSLGIYRMLKFDAYSEDWLEFVVSNRQGKNLWKEFDIIEGGIANDRIFNTIELYSTGLISKSETLQRLKYQKPNNQICILNQEIIDKYLTFQEAFTIPSER
jgi:hypothetical protein